MSRSQRRLWLYLVYAGLAVVSLACTSFELRADDAAIWTHLPTLTRTPLPTLTPTPNATHVAVAMASEPATTGSVSDPPPADSAAPVADTPLDPSSVAQVAPDTAAGNAPAATVDSAVTHLAGAAQQPQAVAALSTSTPPPTETPSPTATTIPPTPTETAIPTETPTPTVTPLPQGWVFTDVRLGPAPDGRDLLVSGNLINNTGTPQILDTIDGLFFDSQGQPLDNTFYALDYPINEVPQGGRIPFQIRLKDRPNATDFDLQVLAEAGGDTPRQDFEFLEVNATPQDDEYCVAGKVRNPGSELDSYLLVAAVLYDSENKVINYDYDYFDEALPVLTGEQTQDVTLCVDPLQQDVARYEMAAWGM